MTTFLVVVAAVVAAGGLIWLLRRIVFGRPPRHKHSRARQTWRSVSDEEERTTAPSVSDEEERTAAPSLLGKVWRFLAKVWRWFWTWITYRFRRKHALLPQDATQRGLYRLDVAPGGGSTRIAVLGDWGSGLDATAGSVVRAVDRASVDAAIHLGDIYRVGAAHEVDHHCLGEQGGLRWPTPQASFAVPGNHEYMSGGDGYFQRFLGHLGIRDGDRLVSPQRTSYFCLDVGDWRLVGLDTGRCSVHFAGLELLINLVNLIPGIDQAKTWLPRPIVAWLRDDVRIGGDDQRGVILLSHHQFVTALDSRGDYPQPGRQIAKLLTTDRSVVWFWGHEHRFSAYHGRRSGRGPAGRLVVHGRAVGNSGVDADPVRDVDKLKTRIRRKGLAYADNRVAVGGHGHNGFALLTISGPTLNVRHLAVEDREGGTRTVLEEEFHLLPGGRIGGPTVLDVLEHPDVVTPASLRLRYGIEPPAAP